jgi:hypothetical protein
MNTVLVNNKVSETCRFIGLLLERWQANNACSGQLGVAAFSGSFQHLSKIRFRALRASRPVATNASRWAAYDSMQ